MCGGDGRVSLFGLRACSVWLLRCVTGLCGVHCVCGGVGGASFVVCVLYGFVARDVGCVCGVCGVLRAPSVWCLEG